MNIQEILRKNGSDKVTHHSYGPTYNSLFEPLQNSATDILEIGVLEGCSVRAWEEYFPNAKIVGFDNEPHRLVNAGRITSHLIDTKDRPEFRALCQKLPSFDIIIDDASHVVSEQLWACWALWLNLKPGGLYIIEDIYHAVDLAPFACFQNAELHDWESTSGVIADRMVVIRKAK